MKKYQLFLIIIVIIVESISTYTLGPNLLLNNEFSLPNIVEQGFIWKSFPSPILGWNCSNSCQIHNCQSFNRWVAHWRYGNGFSGDCPYQSLDINAESTGWISQIFEAQAGEHVLQIKYLLPVENTIKKTFIVTVNQQIVNTMRPIFPDFNSQQISLQIVLKDGLNSIVLATEGHNDPSGFRLFDIKIRRIIQPQASKAIDLTTNNLVANNVVAIPFSRIIFGELVNSMISFDRLQLYYYHHRKYSYYYDVLLKRIADLLDQKGTYASFVSYYIFSLIGTSEQSISQLINFKSGRKYKDGYEQNNFLQNGGFFFIVSYIPMALIIFFTFYALFRLTFNCKISNFFRKYSFFSLILLMLFEGNIEQFSFIIIDEFLEYFSASITHKALNFIIFIIFYLMFFCSTVFYFYFWSINRKKISYLTDNIALKIEGIMTYTLDRGLICLVLGSAHRLTLLMGKQQLLILAAVQMVFIGIKISFLLYSSYKCKRIGCINLTQAVVRICFIFSVYIYEDSGDMRGMINGIIHINIIYMFITVWTISLVFTIIEVAKGFLSKQQFANKQVGKLKQRKEKPNNREKQIQIKINRIPVRIENSRAYKSILKKNTNKLFYKIQII